MSAYPVKAATPAEANLGLIEKEIAHLKKGKSVRYGPNAGPRRSSWLITAAIAGLCWLYFMDAILFSYHRGEAIKTYLYLHNYGDDKIARDVASCGLLGDYDIQLLDKKQGSFQDYFGAMNLAVSKAHSLVDDMKQVGHLHRADYDDLTSLNKLRYFLFIKTGLTPPTRLDFLNPTIK